MARKRCIILKREKLPYQLRIILGKLLYLGVFIQFWANLCGKNLKLYFRGKFFRVNFLSSGEILNLWFLCKFYFLGAFSVLSVFCMGNLKSLFWGQIYRSIFLKLRDIFSLGAKLLYCLALC